ncbi:hypothetical protein E2320_004923 [Naja naja]|nr:hypothetical protein E2320_004923 [Naja naja]
MYCERVIALVWRYLSGFRFLCEERVILKKKGLFRTSSSNVRSLWSPSEAEWQENPVEEFHTIPRKLQRLTPESPLTGFKNSICVRGFDPNLSMMTGITPINPLLSGMGLVPQPPQPKSLSSRRLFTVKAALSSLQTQVSKPDLPPPSTRERPPGCKTVFVGGLPENATEEIIQEVFEKCGDITAIRKSKKNFCHIRFSEEFMVDKAIYLSGYRMRLGSSTDKKDSGRLHVDFAQARDDFYEWECKQRMLAREERHRRKMEEDRIRPPSPPVIMHYSEHEASLLAEKLKDDSKFSEAIVVLLTWIERGEVNRRTSNQFYSMVQSANSHVRRLMNEKATHEQEMDQAKDNFKNALMGILTQFQREESGAKFWQELHPIDFSANVTRDIVSENL